MAIFYLVSSWIVAGLIVGLLALAAHFKPAAWGGRGWLWMLLLGMGSALAGGLLGTFLFDRLFALATALWFAVLATFMPWLIINLRVRLAKH